MQELQAEVTSHMCVVNACKCIHVLKRLSPMGTGRTALFPINFIGVVHFILRNFAFHSRCFLTEAAPTCLPIPIEKNTSVQLSLTWHPEEIGKGSMSLRLLLKYWLPLPETTSSDLKLLVQKISYVKAGMGDLSFQSEYLSLREVYPCLL